MLKVFTCLIRDSGSKVCLAGQTYRVGNLDPAPMLRWALRRLSPDRRLTQFVQIANDVAVAIASRNRRMASVTKDIIYVAEAITRERTVKAFFLQFCRELPGIYEDPAAPTTNPPHSSRQYQTEVDAPSVSELWHPAPSLGRAPGSGIGPDLW